MDFMGLHGDFMGLHDVVGQKTGNGRWRASSDKRRGICDLPASGPERLPGFACHTALVPDWAEDSLVPISLVPISLPISPRRNARSGSSSIPLEGGGFLLGLQRHGSRLEA